MALKTDYKDAKLADSMAGRKQYKMITNKNGTVSFVDETEYDVQGDFLYASALNEANKSINDLMNRKTEDLIVTFKKATMATELNSGDKLSIHFSKLAKIVGDAIVHVPAISDATKGSVLRNDGKGLMWYKLPVVDVTFVYGKKVNFPSKGASKTVYVDQTRSQYYLYMWNGSEYCSIGGGASDPDTIMKANTPFTISFTSKDFTINKTTNRYEAVKTADLVSADAWLDWKIVRSGDVLTSSESKISADITDVICSDKSIKVISTSLPSQSFDLKFKLVL